MIFFYKQKKAYEMRISDWSSDVCSSDLDVEKKEQPFDKLRANGKEAADGHPPADRAGNRLRPAGHRAKRRPKPATRDRGDRKSGEEGKSLSVRFVLGGRSIIKKKKNNLNE